VMAQLRCSMAGFETSAQVISFAVWQLSRHPELQQQLRDEINSIPNPTFDDYSTGMPTLDAVMKERYVAEQMSPSNGSRYSAAFA
jgi:cytochrome P450